MSTTETIYIPRNSPKRKVVSQAVATDYAFIKKLIWVYFLLLLFEGALRKWFFPSLSQGLLIVRDPIAIWIYYIAYTQGVFPTNKYLQRCLMWVIVAVLISFIVLKTHPFTIEARNKLMILKLQFFAN